MTKPDEALARARESAARKRAEGLYPAEPQPGALAPTITAERPSMTQLSEWAVIEVEPDVMYSTRRLGAPMTFFKRLLLRLLRQYLVEAEARQTRFNIAMLAAYQELDRRVEELERDRGE